MGEGASSTGAGTPRRRMLLGGVALTLALGGAGCAAEPPPAPTPTPLPVPRGSFSRFGFHIGAPTPEELPRFRQDVDTIRGLEMGWVRFAVLATEVVSSWGPEGTAPRMNEEGLKALDEAVGAARDQGLRIVLITVDVWNHPVSGQTAFLAKMRQYWDAIARRVGDRVDVWQVFNEADSTHYRDQTDVSPSDAGYMAQLARAVGVARDTVRAVAPTVRVTTNLYGYPVDEAMVQRWDLGIAALDPVVDVITLDAYPQLSTTGTERLVDYLATAQQRTGKAVFVGEIGLQTCRGCFSEGDQRRAYELYLSHLADSVAEAVLFYELRDIEGQFGVLTSGGGAKPAFERLQDDEEGG